MIRILIVDDQKSVRENIKLMLSAEPQLEIVGTADNGYKGMEMAEALNPDIILMDLEMPKLDGLTATKLISQKNPALNIIILTIKDQNELLLQSLNAGARGYLLKNSDVREIVSTINLVFEGNRPTSHRNGKSAVPTKNNGSNSYAAALAGTSSYGASEPATSQSNLINPILQPELSWETLGAQPVSSQSKFSFGTFISILKRRYPPALMGFFSVMFGAILYLTFAKRTYQATASLVLQAQQESVSELGKDLNNIEESNEYSLLASQIERIKSRSVLRKALENVDLPENMSDETIRDRVKQVQDRLTIGVVTNTNIIEINYVDEDPEFAAELLNEIVVAVRKRNTEDIREEASSVRKFLEEEVRKQKSEVAKIKAAENDYRQDEGIISLDDQTANLVNNLSDLESKKQELLTQIREQESKVNNLQQVANVNDVQSAYIESKIGQDRQLEELRRKLTDIDTRLATAQTNFTDNNPAVIELKEEKASIQALYQQQIDRLVGRGVVTSSSDVASNVGSQSENGVGESVVENLITSQIQLDADREKLQAIQSEIGKIEDKIALLPSKVQSLTDLVNQQEQATESLLFLQRKLEEAKIAEAQLISNLKIGERANVPTSPFAPNVPAVLAIASLMATVLMMAIILLLEKIDHTLYDAEEIEDSLDLPFLTTLPDLLDYEENPHHITSFLNNRKLYEPYRFLLKRLEAHGQSKCKVIVVSSAVAGEGKSTVASHLGAVSAMLSKRTLIIDAHLHSPKQHNLFGLKLQPGLKEVAESSLNLPRAVQPTKIENLAILAAGNSDSESWMVLESPQMKRILQEASLKYDSVIIDAPAVTNSCDAYTLSQYSDGLMMVTRPFHTPKDVLEKTVLDLKRNKTSIIGFVINSVQKQKYKLDSSPTENDTESYVLPALSSSKPTKNSRKDTEEVRQP